MSRYKFIYSILLLTVVFFISSCKKDMSSTSSGATEVVFEVGGVEDGLELKASSKESMNTAPASRLDIPASVVNLKKGFQVEIYQGQDDMESLQDELSEEVIKLSKNASTSPMLSGKTYRVLMRKVGETNWIFNSQVVVGKRVSVDVEAGSQYEYIAYSYNDNSDVPDPVVSNNFNISTEPNRDLLYASKTFTAVAGINLEKIHFYHKVALLSLNLEMSMFASMVPDEGVEAEISEILYNTANSSKDGKLFTSTLDLMTGTLSSPVAYTPNEIFNDVNTSNLGLRKNDFYTTNVSGLERVKLRLKKFFVTDGSSVNVDLVSQEGVSFLDFIFDFKPGTGRPAISEGHRLRVDLLLLKPLPEMFILSGDTLYDPKDWGSATPWYLNSNAYNLTPS